ncbi:hypothetical protein ACNT2N_26635 [Pseudomonas thivervalensis]|uniref:Uncharacterized protein n=1 Tax=Pseudomonas thivervalensis TaxID=86265 RepID=A0A2Z4ZX67_9PSED|nr:hypothetical protein [Pseudomonas thivervalensis]AXA56690.1 hypothetical protein CE140_20730 [Pseudomonas thivervalensis]AXA62503.1 hypothetical protein CEQ51_21280 [Pseudomonas thivervalensis]
MNNELTEFEDAMYRLYLTFYPNDKPVRTGFDALRSHTLRLISQYPEATAHIISSNAYRLAWRVFSEPFTVERHQPRSLIRLRPARTATYSFDSQQDLALAVRHVIAKPAEPQILEELACMAFKSINRPSLNLDLDSLRESSELLAIAVHKLTRATRKC